MHLTRIFASESLLVREVIGIRCFWNIQCINVKAQSSHRAGTTGFPNAYSAGVTLHRIDIFLLNARFKSALHTQFNFVGIATHYIIRIDHSGAFEHFKSQFFKAINNNACCPEFGPAGFRFGVQTTTEFHHLVCVLIVDIHSRYAPKYRFNRNEQTVGEPSPKTVLM